MDAVTQICPQMTAISIVMFELTKGMSSHSDLYFAQRYENSLEKLNIYIIWNTMNHNTLVYNYSETE